MICQLHKLIQHWIVEWVQMMNCVGCGRKWLLPFGYYPNSSIKVLRKITKDLSESRWSQCQEYNMGTPQYKKVLTTMLLCLWFSQHPSGMFCHVIWWIYNCQATWCHITEDSNLHCSVIFGNSIVLEQLILLTSDELYTGRFIMFSVITNIYNKKTKGPTLMEFFTATGKLKNFFFDN